MGKINSNVVESLSYLNAGSIADNAENSAILEAIYNNGNAVDDVCLHSAICTEFGVDIPPQRLSEILRRLVESGQLIKTANSEYELSSVLAAEILEAKVSFNELERRFIGQWINDNSKASSLSDDEKQTLFSLAVQFIKTLFVQHGVSSYNFLTNQYTAVTFSINDIVKTLSVTLSKDLQDIASVTLPILLASPISQDGLNYYKETINRVTAYRSIAVPTETMQLIKAKLNGLTVYLDTNVLYRILNLQGEYRYETVKLVIDELQNAGVTFCVTPVTLSELKKRLAYDASVITKHIVPCNLAELGYNYRASDNYVSTFWKVRAKTRVSADDFNAKYSQVESLLLDLEIMTESSPIIPDNEIEDSRKEVFSKLGIYDSDKKPNAAWDDSYNVAYVKHRQKKVRQLLLTHSFSL